MLVGDLWHGTSCVRQPTWPMFISAVMLGQVSLLFSSLHTVYNGFQHTQCSPAYWLQTARWTNLYSERKSVCLFLFLPDLGSNLRKFQQVSACMNCFFLFRWPVSCLFKFVFKVVSASFNTDWVRREVDLLVLRFVVNTLNIYHYNNRKGTGHCLCLMSDDCSLVPGLHDGPSHMV